MDIVFQLFFWVVIAQLYGALAIGTTGYFIFRLLNKQKKKIYLELLVLFVIMLGFDYLTLVFIRELEISIGNEQILALLDYDVNSIFDFDILNIVVAGIDTCIGYFVGFLLFKKLGCDGTDSS